MESLASCVSPKKDVKLESYSSRVSGYRVDVRFHSKWIAAVFGGTGAHEEQEPIEWKELRVGAERSVDCELMQAPLNKHPSATLGKAGGSS